MRMLTPIAMMILLGASVAAQETNRLGLPNPEKTDLPYLIHGTSLVALEALDAHEEEKKNELRFWVAGTTSKARTPLAGPEFLFEWVEIDPADLRLYAFEVVKGRREILYRKKKKIVARPFFLDIERIDGKVLRIRVNGSLPPGEYGLTPQGTNDVFCFTVF
jgi:hypothetical protein